MVGNTISFVLLASSYKNHGHHVIDHSFDPTAVKVRGSKTYGWVRQSRANRKHAARGRGGGD